jgi:hypothetical protein
MRTDSHYLRAGDAVVFYPAGSKRGARYADHVGLVAAVHAGGRLDLVNGDFVGSANITVQANKDISLTSWAAAIWGKGETWVRVGPRH